MSSKKQKKPKRKYIKPRDATERLFVAAAKWAEQKGGSVVVAGGPHIQKWPGEPAMNFDIVIKCTGRAPAPTDTPVEKPSKPDLCARE